MTQNSRLANLIDELRRRRVFRVAAFYGGIAFVIVQIIDGTFELMGVPQWVGRMMVTLLALGFPVSMVLAWVFDITPEGIVRTGKVGEDGDYPAVDRKSQPLIGNRALAMIAVVAIIFGLWDRMGLGRGNSNQIRSIAVLPLENQMGDDSQAYFVDGMHEALITAISWLPEIRVISRTSVMLYKDRSVPISQIADELDVDALVEGSVFRVGNKVRITAQLIATRPERHIWSNQFQRDIVDVMALHNEVAMAIADQIELKIGLGRHGAERPERKVDPEAYDLYLKAKVLYPWTATEMAIVQSIGTLRDAVEIDPKYHEAWVEISRRESIVNFKRRTRSPTNQPYGTDGALNHVITLAPTAASTSLAVGYYHYYRNLDYLLALQSFHTVLSIDSNNLDALETIGYVERRMGLFEESLEKLLLVHKSDPNNWDLTRSIGQTYLVLRNFHKSLTYLELAYQLDKNDFLLIIDLARTMINLSVPPVQIMAYFELEDWNIAQGDYLWLIDYLSSRIAIEMLAMPEQSYDTLLSRWPTSIFKSIPNFDLQNYMHGIGASYSRQPTTAARHMQVALDSFDELSQSDQDLLTRPLSMILALTGNKEAAVTLGQKLVDLLPYSSDSFTGPTFELHLAEINIKNGDIESAIEIIERNLNRPSEISWTLLEVDPRWWSLRQQPEYSALRARYGQ